MRHDKRSCVKQFCLAFLAATALIVYLGALSAYSFAPLHTTSSCATSYLLKVGKIQAKNNAIPSRGNTERRAIKLSKSNKSNTLANGSKQQQHNNHYNSLLANRAVKIYTDYAKRLWLETNPEARKLVAENKAANVIRQVQQIMANENDSTTVISPETRIKLLTACDEILLALAQNAEVLASQKKREKEQIEEQEKQTQIQLQNESNSVQVSTVSTEKQTEDSAVVDVTKRKSRSVLFGSIMGAGVACWVFSGNYIFTALFTLMTILGQLEYYRMVMNTGVYPARRISIVGACSMFLTALFFPNYHQICLPLFGLWTMIWFLTMRRTVTKIPEIATSFTGMFYLGYVPSFWVRIRLIGAGREPTRLASLAGPILRFVKNNAESNLPNFVPKAVHLPITTGAVFIFWTWLCLAFNDVGAYFVGRKYGKTKLGAISPAAGATSPNKSVEGVLGGCAVSAMLGMLGAWVMRWPYWIVTGAAHGVLLGLIGLIGDLTASMIKRDAGIKDFGDLIPEHGGILDRVDGFIWTAPYSWLVCSTVIPALKSMASQAI